MLKTTISCKNCSETNTIVINCLSQMKIDVKKKYSNADTSILTVINDVCLQIDHLISNITIALENNLKIELEEHLYNTVQFTDDFVNVVKAEDENDPDPIEIKLSCDEDEEEYNDETGSDDNRDNDGDTTTYSYENDEKKLPVKKKKSDQRQPQRRGKKGKNPVKPWRRPKQCKQCNDFVGTWRQILQHRIKVHDLPKPYKCDKCPMTFYHSYLLNNHSKSLHREIIGKRPYICEICSKVLSSKHGLKTHKLIHTTERPYECEICACMFKGKKDIAKHMKVHSNNRSFVCDICSKTFKQRESFRFHMNTHYGIKPNKCQLCDKAFLQKSKLDRHMLSHTGERPVSCPICSKRYTTRYAVKHHLRTVHKIDDVDKVFGRVLKDCEKYGKNNIASGSSSTDLNYCDSLIIDGGGGDGNGKLFS